MNRVSILIAALIVSFGVSAIAEQYDNIKPGLRCHFPRKNRSFCKTFPNFSLRHGICNPEPEGLGNIEWCREDIVVTDHGRPVVRLTPYVDDDEVDRGIEEGWIEAPRRSGLATVTPTRSERSTLEVLAEDRG